MRLNLVIGDFFHSHILLDDDVELYLLLMLLMMLSGLCVIMEANRFFIAMHALSQ